MATTSGYETMRSGEIVLYYVNRDGMPLSERCNERMWTFCMQQYPKHATEIQAIRDRTGNHPPISYPEPPYHIANNSRMTVQEKLQHIQSYIRRLEYNYTGMQFFELNPSRPLSGLMDSARHIMTESLPIKCFEAFLIALYLTTGIIGLDRFNISFKTCFNSIIYRHVVLGVKYGQFFGALGISRRNDLSYKPLCEKYDRLSTLIHDFVAAYQNYGHTVLRIIVGLPIIHDLKSFLTINWNVLAIHPNTTAKNDYDRQLDKIVRIWRQNDIHMTYKTVVSLTSLVQPAGKLITAASLPHTLESVSVRQSNQQGLLTCRQSVNNKNITVLDEGQPAGKDKTQSYNIRV